MSRGITPGSMGGATQREIKVYDDEIMMEDMTMRLMINGKEVTNPAVKAVVGSFMMGIVVLVMAFLFFVLLPLIGLGLGIGLAAAGTAIGSLGVGVPLLRSREVKRLKM